MGNIKALARNQKEDNPLLIFLELIGNDVCKKSFDSMTKEADFEKSVISLLEYLDEKVQIRLFRFLRVAISSFLGLETVMFCTKTCIMKLTH